MGAILNIILGIIVIFLVIKLTLKEAQIELLQIAIEEYERILKEDDKVKKQGVDLLKNAKNTKTRKKTEKAVIREE